jgi:two-component system response regulator RegA
MTNSMPAIETEPSSWVNRSLLIAEDDKPFLQRLARAMEIRGFEVVIAESVADGFLVRQQAGTSSAPVVSLSQ